MISPDLRFIVRDNESAAAEAIESGHFIAAFLLVHALVESLLRAFLNLEDQKKLSFSDLVQKYAEFLEEQRYPTPEFVDDLTQFNRRRNRIVHELWRRGYSWTNRKAEPAARAAVLVYGLFIEWLSTFDPEILERGFSFDDA